jgi:hypothetical protein
MTELVMMQCGHAANAKREGHPCCVICVGIDPGATIVAEAPDLTGRLARCSCGAISPSEFGLAFFEYRGPGSRKAEQTCGSCGFSIKAHSQDDTRTTMNVIARGKCEAFVPHGSYEYDDFYCGCRGWN